MLIFIAHNGKTLELDVESSTRYSLRMCAELDLVIDISLLCSSSELPYLLCMWLLSVTLLVNGLKFTCSLSPQVGLLNERTGLHCEGVLLAVCVILINCCTITALEHDIGLAHLFASMKVAFFRACSCLQS